VTRTAREAFDARAGNCLSLVLMTAALAKELGLEVRYQRVFADDAWSRVGELHVASSHVNVTLGRKSGDPRALFSERNLLTIDFMQTRRGRPYRAFAIREATVVAMYMNNRAAEALAAGRVDDAYWWARAAVGQAPAFFAAWNTLGVIYRHRGHLREAEAVLSYILEREPANTSAMSNLALVLGESGHPREAAALSERLARLEPVPPLRRGARLLHPRDRARRRVPRVPLLARGRPRRAGRQRRRAPPARPRHGEQHHAGRAGDVRREAGTHPVVVKLCKNGDPTQSPGRLRG
jgi:tetratricopeptide (TPR) repeat protein